MRRLKGWSRYDLEWQTHLVVEELAKKEPRRSRINKRYEERSSKKKLTGISLNALASIEKGNPTYPFTLKIVAAALGVEMQTLLDPQDPLFEG